MIQLKRMLKQYIYYLTGYAKYAYPPYNYLLVSHKYQFVYCPIPKVAISSVKAWMLELHGSDDFRVDNDLHQQAQAMFGLPSNGIAPRTIDGYLKFAFVRNPAERLVSAYLNKFVVHFNQDRLPEVRRIIASYGRGEDMGISFLEFLDYLERTDLDLVDLHWRPQHRLLGNLDYDFIGKIENFDADFEHVSSQLHVPPPSVVLNSTKTARDYVDDDYLSKRSGELRKLKYPPPAKMFLGVEIVSRIRELYRQDYELLNY